MCIYLRFRSKKYQKYIYCKKKKKEINFCDCKNCKYKAFKEVKEENKILLKDLTSIDDINTREYIRSKHERIVQRDIKRGHCW